MTRDHPPAKWIEFPRPNPQARLRLFCFPYAGGSTLIYRNWHQSLPPSVEVCAVQLPGRGIRLREPPLRDTVAVVKHVTEVIYGTLDKPFAFFGHSMGALVSFETARNLRRLGVRQPEHLFVSGRSAPKFRYPERPLHALPEGELMDELRRLNGTPREVLDNPELMSLMLPTLRADFEVCETYKYTPEAPLGCPVSVQGGLQDDIERARLEAWAEETCAGFSLEMFPGDHFFLHTSTQLLLRSLSQHLEQVVGRLS